MKPIVQPLRSQRRLLSPAIVRHAMVTMVEVTKLAFGLSKPAPDLTHLAIRNGGAFPRERVARLIDGREQMDSHNREMPIWGDWFKLEAEEGFDGPAGDEAKIRKRIDDLVDLLQSMQEH